MRDYKKDIKIPHDGDFRFKFFTASGLHVASGYQRVVFGKRGPYIEFQKGQVLKHNIHVPDNEKWRLDASQNCKVYYYEYRTNEDNVMIYLQKKTVDYADYKVGLVYISPFDLYDEMKKPIIGLLRGKPRKAVFLDDSLDDSETI